MVNCSAAIVDAACVLANEWGSLTGPNPVARAKWAAKCMCYPMLEPSFCRMIQLELLDTKVANKSGTGCRNV